MESRGVFTTAFWRKWHRWIGFPAAIFLLFAATTGFLVAFTEFFGAEEALRERTRDLVSPVTLASPTAAWLEPLSRAVATAQREIPGAPVDKIVMQFKGDAPTITIFTGKPMGGEDRKLVVNARTGSLIAVESYADTPFLYRLHSGEWFGDGGLVFAMAWAVALVLLTITGFIISRRMRRPGRTGWQRVFW